MNLLIADDHTMHRQLICSLLDSVYPDATITQAESYPQVEAACARRRPALLILDIFMPGMNGLVGACDIIHGFPETKVLVCSAVDNPILIQTMLAFGARGYVSKTMSAESLLAGIDAVLNGNTYVPRDILSGAEGIHLTQRQWEILGMVCMGLSNKEIADRLGLSVSTVKFHISLILDTLKVHNRQQAISLCSLA
ncbi:MAG TPA: response regulator transcription factor [Mariprofundaceae bacterium]|nr:response regulator transcription factor [Mariprofundaceae bacterium]